MNTLDRHQAKVDAYDHKLHNIRNIPVSQYAKCPHCHRYGHHAWDCHHATNEDFQEEIKRSHGAEKWARKRAADFLQMLRFEQLKNAQMRERLRKARK